MGLRALLPPGLLLAVHEPLQISVLLSVPSILHNTETNALCRERSAAGYQLVKMAS